MPNPSDSSIDTYSALEQLLTTRFIELAPGSPSDLLECSITTTPLMNATPYEALSYTWGENVESHQILIRSHLLPINSNEFSSEKAT